MHQEALGRFGLRGSGCICEDALVNSVEVPPPASFSEVLSAAIQRRGLSLERIRARLEAAGVPVSIATLSYWQSGRSLPTRSRSHHTLVELERILDLDSGALTSLTHSTAGRRRRAVFPWDSVVPLSDMATDIIESLGMEMPGHLARVTMQDVLHIKADRTEGVQLTSILWRAERNGLHRWPIVMEQDADDDGAVPTVEALSGCVVGEVVEVPDRHLLVAEMLASRPLQRGDHLLARYQTTFARTRRLSYRMSRSVADPLRALSLIVEFDERALPSNVSYSYQESVEAEPLTVAPVELTACEAQVSRVDTAPGVHSLMWDWD